MYITQLFFLVSKQDVVSYPVNFTLKYNDKLFTDYDKSLCTALPGSEISFYLPIKPCNGKQMEESKLFCV